MIKKYLPFVLPLLALLLVAYFGIRWYRGLTDEELDTPEISTASKVESLPSDDRASLDALTKGLGDFKTIKMETDLAEAMGELRFKIEGGKALFSVIANLATDENQIYHLFVKAKDSTEFVDVQTLLYEKGGLIASSSLTIDQLPAQIEVRLAETVVLRATLPAATDGEVAN